MNDPTKLYRARRIITMDPQRPDATHVAVQGDTIRDVGGPELEQVYGPSDPGFLDRVLVPGFVEGHAHALEGTIWSLPYVGFYPRLHPDGGTLAGCNTPGALIERLRQLERQLADPQAPLFAWGYDPIYFGDDKPMRAALDRVSTTRPLVLYHGNLHLITVNSLTLKLAGIHRDNAVHGVYLDRDGNPNGELAEPPAMFLVLRVVGDPVYEAMDDPEGYRRYGRSAHRSGVTTASDLYSSIDHEVLPVLETVTREADFPIRMVPALQVIDTPPAAAVERAQALADRGNKQLYLGSVKLVVDGSIQGYSARVRQPYINGVQNGVWVAPPTQMQDMMRVCNAARVKMHIHVNGDEASEFALEGLAHARSESGHQRQHVLQHAQMMDRAQLAKAADLGLAVNLFANHTYYWGDQHRDMTVGPDIAPRMNAARTALDLGLTLSIHCDAPVTPMGPLFTAWCAVNRLTASGRLHGPNERITAFEALRAVTLGAAETLDLQDRIGSIAPGKYADFAVLADDPLQVDPMRICEIRVDSTVLGGRIQPCPPQCDAVAAR